MTDYELYGDYNRGDEDEEPQGPPKSPVWTFLGRLIRIVAAVLLSVIVVTLACRIILSHWYPKSVRRLFYTEALSAYAAAGGDMSALTQEIRVPFEGEYLESDGQTTQVQTSRNGYYYADNLIVVPGAGAVQFSIRLNKHAFEEIAAQYRLTDFQMAQDAFEFTLIDNLGNTYAPSAVSTASKFFYHYYKLCFDGLQLEGVSWLRLNILPRGADTEAEDYRQLTVCVYEDNPSYNTFETYRLKKSERYKA